VAEGPGDRFRDRLGGPWRAHAQGRPGRLAAVRGLRVDRPAQPLPTIGSPRAARPKSSGGWFAAALGAADPVTPGVIVPRAQGGRDHIGEVL
jgi:hypothetical protein